jgi:hypothetical protein
MASEAPHRRRATMRPRMLHLHWQSARFGRRSFAGGGLGIRGDVSLGFPARRIIVSRVAAADSKTRRREMSSPGLRQFIVSGPRFTSAKICTFRITIEC